MAEQKRDFDGFLLNEPARVIPGGSTRRSITVDRALVPIVARRERLNALLIVHDTLPPREAPELDEQDFALLRQIASEGVITGVLPAVRYQAIVHLGRFPSRENLNVAEELATSGEDHFVRAHALLALGHSGFTAVLPMLRDALMTKDRLERAAAISAIRRIARVDRAAVDRLIAAETRKKLRAALERAATLPESERPRKQRNRRTARRVPKG